jgi:hypothetical protein
MIIRLTLSREGIGVVGGGGAGGEGTAVVGIPVWEATCCSFYMLKSRLIGTKMNIKGCMPQLTSSSSIRRKEILGNYIQLS